eukprot:gnl/Chilomastix_cuspidata/138.p1 GENE.gnl/Chilomastix_cuspidata/138~~gnl/Chilomastix_cuspidata/138.p1  ORF type:complete len:169 (-),score=31.05 gnl/Chilomastix_cuspidata/138:31-537(-)
MLKPFFFTYFGFRMSSDESFDLADAGASLTYPAPTAKCKKGCYIMLKGFPCKIVEKSISKTGKHGHAKAHVVGIELFSGKKYEDIIPASHNCTVPVVKNDTYDVLHVDDGDIHVMLDTGETREDIKVPEGSYGEELVEAYESMSSNQEMRVTVLSAMGKEKVIDYQVS